MSLHSILDDTASHSTQSACEPTLFPRSSLLLLALPRSIRLGSSIFLKARVARRASRRLRSDWRTSIAEELATRYVPFFALWNGADPEDQFMHLPSKHERRFLETLLEKSHSSPLSKAQQLGHWELLANSEAFDHWCAKKFPSVKRYGLEGAEGMMVALGVVLEEAKARGMDDVVLCVSSLLAPESR